MVFREGLSSGDSAGEVIVYTESGDRVRARVDASWSQENKNLRHQRQNCTWRQTKPILELRNHSRGLYSQSELGLKYKRSETRSLGLRIRYWQEANGNAGNMLCGITSKYKFRDPGLSDSSELCTVLAIAPGLRKPVATTSQSIFKPTP